MCDLPSMTVSVNAHFNSCRKGSKNSFTFTIIDSSAIRNETFKSIYWGELGSVILKDLKVQRSVTSPNQCSRWNTTRVYHHGLQSPTPLFTSKLTALSFRMSGVASWTYIRLVHCAPTLPVRNFLHRDHTWFIYIYITAETPYHTYIIITAHNCS